MQTTSFELSKKLKEVGIKFSCPTYYWCYYIGQIHLFRNSINSSDNAYDPISNVLYITERHQIRPEKEEGIVAYTLDEILEMLPSYIDIKNAPAEEAIFRLSFFKDIDKKLYCFYFASCQIKYKNMGEYSNRNPAEAAGQLLIWCIENGYVKVDKDK
jgi:hypothetical protein